MIEPLTEAERALDLNAKLHETDVGIAYLRGSGVAIPEEAIEIRAIIRRALVAEAALARVASPPPAAM